MDVPFLSRPLKRLERTFGYRPLENYTTELLAGLLELEPGPFLDALVETLGLRLPVPPLQLSVDTEHGVGNGVVDLCITLRNPARHHVLWVEVKCYAEEHDGQLTRYQQASRRRKPQPEVLLLGRRELGARVPFLSWQQLRAHVMRSASASAPWREFIRHLEYYKLADHFDEPIGREELTGFPVNEDLQQKVARAITRTLTIHQVQFERPSYWPLREPVALRTVKRGAARDVLCARTEYSRDSPTPISIACGAWRNSHDGELQWGVRVEGGKHAGTGRIHNIWEMGKQLDLRPEWFSYTPDLIAAPRSVKNFLTISTATVAAIARSKPLTQVRNQEDAIEFLSECLNELRRTGFLPAVEHMW